MPISIPITTNIVSISISDKKAAMERVSSVFFLLNLLFMAKNLPFWGQKREFWIMSLTICHCEIWTPQKYIFAVMITIIHSRSWKWPYKDFRVEKAGGFKLSLQTPFSPSSSPSQRELAVPLLAIHHHSMAACPIVGSVIQIRIPSQQWLILVHIYTYMRH